MIKRAKEQLHRLALRLTHEDRKLLAELRALMPQPCSQASALRYALRAAVWLVKHRAAGAKITVTCEDGRIETVFFGF